MNSSKLLLYGLRIKSVAGQYQGCIVYLVYIVQLYQECQFIWMVIYF